MKKLLLLTAGTLLAGSVFAQGNTGESQEQTWTLTVKRTDVEPNGDGDVLPMTVTSSTTTSMAW